MSKTYVVANWKMHFSVPQSARLVSRLDQHIKPRKDVEIVLCAPFIALASLQKKLDPKKFALGAQNLHFEDEGTFTGEVSGAMMKDLVEYVIVGHSERRKNFGETDKIVARKAAAAVRNRLTPIICIGENLIQYHNKESGRVVHDQLEAALSMLTGEDIKNVILTYEPSWAISPGSGHGDIASATHIAKSIALMHKTVTDLYGKSVGAKVPILYGGSVNPDFSKAYLKIPRLDGFLVGGASLNYEQFTAIVRDAQSK